MQDDEQGPYYHEITDDLIPPDDLSQVSRLTVRSYQTNSRFDREQLQEQLRGGKLGTLGRFGFMFFLSKEDADDVRAVLAVQGEQRIRRYDPDRERIRWFSWDNAILDTVAIRYAADSNGLMRFTTFGGGTRITAATIHEFHWNFLRIRKSNVSALSIGTELARERFLLHEFLYKLHSVKAQVEQHGYQSIDQTTFKSRKFIDPDCERMLDLRNDPNLIVEEFESQLTLDPPSLAKPLTVRFTIRSSSDAVSLRIPTIHYRRRFNTPQRQARAFYSLVDTIVTKVIGPTLFQTAEVDPAHIVFDDDSIGVGDLLTPLRRTEEYQDYLSKQEGRRTFLDTVDLADLPRYWQPHLRALDALLKLGAHEFIVPDLEEFVEERPSYAAAMLERCAALGLDHLGRVLFDLQVAALLDLPRSMWPSLEPAILDWAARDPKAPWYADPGLGLLHLNALSFSLPRLEPRRRAAVLLGIARSIQGEVLETKSTTGERLASLHWCLSEVAKLDVESRGNGALHFFTHGGLESSREELGRGLKLDHTRWTWPDIVQELWRSAKAPLWPYLELRQHEEGWALSNAGPSAALHVMWPGQGEPVDIAPKASVPVQLNTASAPFLLTMRHFEQDIEVTLEPVAMLEATAAGAPGSTEPRVDLTPPVQALRAAQQAVDPKHRVVGVSQGLLKLFFDISIHNQPDRGTGRLANLLLLGESGVGKTHFANLIHEHSKVRDKPFIALSGSDAGQGDENIIRGEWIGYGVDHGIRGVRDGKAGHLQRAEGGTLFVDDFEQLPVFLQHIFLSVLEGRPVTLLSGKEYRPNVRCIFATNQQLDVAINEKRIRHDLVNRLEQLSIPPLRARREDIFPLVRHFASDSRRGRTVTSKAMSALLTYDWPANVRELKRLMGNAHKRCDALGHDQIDLSHLEGLPAELLKTVLLMTEDECEQQVWQSAAAFARAEGFEVGRRGMALQARLTELLEVSKSEASRKYKKYIAS